MKLEKKHLIYFLIIYILMQIIDLILTGIALKNPAISEMNPLYGSAYFIIAKLIVVPVILYSLFNHYKDTCPKAVTYTVTFQLLFYTFVIINNTIQIIAN